MGAEALLVLEKNAKVNLRKLRHPKTKMPVRHVVTRTSEKVTVKAYIEDEYRSRVGQALGL